ncbi:MAG: EamA family transporter, partial [Firmicutes bacterium]|nr:EamA family transporter [Bacillota bacterium]
MNKDRFIYISAMLIFGSIGLVSRNIMLSSGQTALSRGVIGSIFLLVASRVLKEKIEWKVIKPNLLLLVLSGAAIGFNWILMFEAYKYTSIANATL